MTKRTGKLPVMACDTKSWTHLNNLQLADPEFSVPNDIDLLLGTDVFYDLILGDKKTGPTGSALAVKSKLGWLVAGGTSAPTTHLQVNFSEVNLEQTLTKFWELESVPHSKVLTPEESLCEEIFVKTHTRDSTGHYIVHIPFKIPQVQLGSSRERARRRFLQLEKRLEAKPNIQKLYRDFMNKYEELGHMEHIKSWAPNPRRNFLPHQFVLKDTQKLEKFCVVFDGSAKTSSGVSFNETQLVGEQLQDPLMTILMRFRQHPIGFTADIAKMFRQIRVAPVHQELQCVLWRNDPTSGPFLATRVLKQMALDEEARLPLTSAVTKMDFYVDDLISGAETEELAYQTIQQLREITDSAGQCLRKFASNSQFALKDVPLDLKETTELLSMDDGDEVVKTLGIHWNTVTDSFMFKVKPHPSSKKLTKRNVLSEISMIFDPMGWLAPSIICNKILMQDIWKEKIGWDDLLSQPILDRWINFKESLFFFEQIKIPRCFAPKYSSTLELHGFLDASEKAYAAVVYIRALSSAGQINVSIITSKTKAAPVQTVSIPRLELCAAELLAELMDALQTALQLKFVDIRAWTDSTIVLAWINASPSRWKKFVANRVTKIQEVLSPAQWNHVSGVENPADCASRGISPEELLHHKLWWTGPRWLHDIEPHPAPSPVLAVDDELLKSSMEEKTLLVAATTVEWEFLHQFSSLLKLKRVTAYIRRFINNIQQRILQKKSLDHQTKFLTGPLLVSELNSALIVWIKKAQNMVFETEIQRCKDGLPICNTSKILSLSPFIDHENILRVGGRLRHAKIHNDVKHPILLPRHNRLTEILIQHEHEKTYHGGPQLVQGLLSQRFWIIRAQDAIRFQIKKCIICTRYKAQTVTQQMGNLPSVRVNPSRAFKTTGVDYAGPFVLRAIPARSKVTFKAYITLFVCLVTRAIHLELVSSLSTDAFLAALRRFVGRRGRPAEMSSDCGTNFIGAVSEMKKFKELFGSSKHNSIVADFLSQRGIQWHFNPPSAPHFVSIWEAGVKSVKFHLHRIVGPVRLTFEEMTTILIQIEGCLNSRPLTPLSCDPMDLTALTPGHFLIGDALEAVPEPDLTTERVNRLTRWQLVQQLQQHFWKRWPKKYLTRLQQRPRWMTQQRDIRVDDMVLLKTDGISPTYWPLARVIDVHPGSDGLVRTVTLRTPNGELKRPIVKLCLLPLDGHHSDSTKYQDII